MSVPNKISQAVLLGNCTKSFEFLKFVNEISSNVVIVRGEYDNGFLPANKQSRTRETIPINTVLKQGDFKIGCCSGYTIVPKNDPLSLLALARQLDVDIMLWGGTHNVEAFTLEGKFFVNPGSCTGAFNTDWPFTNEEEPKLTESNKKTAEAAEVKEKVPATEQVPEGVSEPVKVDDTEQEVNTANKQEVSDDKVEKKEEVQSDEENTGEGESIEDNLELPELEVDGSNTPSFCLLDIQGSTCTLFIYIYVDGEVKVDKVVYQKEN